MVEVTVQVLNRAASIAAASPYRGRSGLGHAAQRRGIDVSRPVPAAWPASGRAWLATWGCDLGARAAQLPGHAVLVADLVAQTGQRRVGSRCCSASRCVWASSSRPSASRVTMRSEAGEVVDGRQSRRRLRPAGRRVHARARRGRRGLQIAACEGGVGRVQRVDACQPWSRAAVGCGAAAAHGRRGTAGAGRRRGWRSWAATAGVAVGGALARAPGSRQARRLSTAAAASGEGA